MRKIILALAICATVAFACQKDDGAETADAETTAADTARPAGLVMPEAGRAETLLRAADIPFEPRNDLIREFPDGCVWHAVYASSGPEIILETYAFEDLDAAARFGVTAIAQPGGSRRDQDSIEAADEHGIALVFTGRRHFLH